MQGIIYCIERYKEKYIYYRPALRLLIEMGWGSWLPLLVASGSKCDKLKEIFDFRNRVNAWPCLKVGASIHLGFPQLEWVIEMQVY